MGNIQNKKISSSSNVLSSSPSSVQQQQQESILTKNNLNIQHPQQQQQQKQISLNKSLNDIVQQNNTSDSNLNYTQRFSFFHLSTSRSFKNFSQSRNNSRKINKSNPTINTSTPAAETELAKLSKTYWPIPYLEAIFLPHFPINRQSFKNQYNIEQLLAKGAYGNVYKVIDCKNHNEYALKVLNKAQIIKEIGVEQLKNEVDIQKTCGHHPFIVQGLSVWQNHRHIYLLSEYVSGGELFENISHFTYELIQIFVAEIALALDFLHNAGVIYRDLKPENILLDEKYHIQLIDFGFSKWLKIGNTTRTICGTLQYMAPEILRGETYGHAVDWWALGVIVYRMVTNEFPNTTKLLLKRYENKDKKNIDANAINNNNNNKEKETKDNGNDDADNDQDNEDGQHRIEMLNNEPHQLLISYDKNQFNNENDVNALNDLIKRLLEFNAKKRIHSVMAIKRIAIYKNYNFDNVQKKKISECSLNGHQPETIGLEGIKFRLDEMGDITWFNDLINPMHNENLCECNNESANILYCCETFEIIDELSDGPGLLFGTFSGHSIEFKTDTFTPDKTMKLNCNGWYTLLCKRLQEEQSISQQAPFTLLSAFNEGYFNDGSIKSSEEIQFYLHSPILRLNGFDCSMNYQPNVKMAKTSSSVISSTSSSSPSSSDTTSSSTVTTTAINKQQNQIKISIIAPSSPSASVITTTTTKTSQTTSSTNKLTSSSVNNKKSFKLLNNNSSSSSPSSTTENYKISSLLLSPNLLLSPSLEIFQLSSKIATNLSNSFNCLTNIKKSELFVDDQQQQQQNCNNINNNNNNNITNNNLISTSLMSLNKKFPTTSSSDSDLQTSSSNNTNNCNNNKNIFNFNRPPLSPYRSKSPSFSLSIETPPSSPLTPISVLQTLPSVMLMPILQWIYSESLPSNLEEDICEKIIQFADSTAPLQKMIEPCKQYLRLIKLKKFVITIVIDAHNCLNKIIHIINPTNVSHVPFNLCLIFKQIIREAAVGCAKLLQFCNVFVKDAFDISRGQRHEIIKYAKSRFPIFLVQFHQILKNILTILSNLNEEEKTELVVYLVPEIKTSLGLLTELINEIKSSLEKMCKHINSTTNNFKENTTANVTSTTITSTTSPTIVTTNRRMHNNRNLDIGNDYSNVSGGGNCINNNGVMSDGNCTSNCYHHPTTNFDITSPTNFGNSQINLRFVLYMYEVKKLRDIYGRVTSALDIIQQKRIAFNEMNNINKEETIRRNLKHLINEIPGYITIIEDLSNSLNDELGWKEFKFFFKLATSQINGVVLKLVDHRSALNDAVTYICQLVQKNQFAISLIDLGLLEPNNNLQNHCEPPDDINLNYDFYSPKINLIQHLCEPPNAAQSSLSKNALRLLHSKHLTDMEFEIIGFPSDRTKLLTPDYDVKYQCYENNYNIHRFKAHRVIVAARCEWFRKALSCGMKESINRKIIIHDTSPVIFGRLLLYLYGAPIDNTVGAEQICELMLLADRYSVDELKAICEKTLKSLIDDSSVLCLLEIADRYNAGFLKANCLSYISQHIELINSDIFADLSMPLKNEVQDLIQWCGRIPEPWIDKPKNSSRHSLKSPSRISRSRRSSPSYM